MALTTLRALEAARRWSAIAPNAGKSLLQDAFTADHETCRALAANIAPAQAASALARQTGTPTAVAGARSSREKRAAISPGGLF